MVKVEKGLGVGGHVWGSEGTDSTAAPQAMPSL